VAEIWEDGATLGAVGEAPPDVPDPHAVTSVRISADRSAAPVIERLGVFPVSGQDT
jgi:hypothetical protein